MTAPASPSPSSPPAPPAAGGKSEKAPGTSVGNYFVANYPPFSFWRPERVGDALAALDRPGDPAASLGLYLHIPFCRLRCKFCYFRVYTEMNAREVEDYLDALAREVELHARRPVYQGRSLRFVYFGGGTPSYISTTQLRTLVDRLRAALPWDRAEEVTFECEPGTLTRKKLETIREIGVTRLSLGVENFDDRILEENGRAHRSAEIARAYGEAREVGFPQINVDLIAGMVGETEANWRDSVQKVIALSPESVTIYQMELPFNTEISRQILKEGKISPVADWPQKRAWVDLAYRELEAAGYRVSSGYTLSKGQGQGKGGGGGAGAGGSSASFLYRDALWRGADLLGAGVASFSHISGVHFQNADQFQDYIERVRRGELPIHRALAMTPRERLIRELVLQLKLGAVDAGYFRSRFGVEIREEFRPQLESLRERGLACFDGDRVALSREALLRVDELLPPFFLPEHRGARVT